MVIISSNHPDFFKNSPYGFSVNEYFFDFFRMEYIAFSESITSPKPPNLIIKIFFLLQLIPRKL